MHISGIRVDTKCYMSSLIQNFDKNGKLLKENYLEMDIYGIIGTTNRIFVCKRDYEQEKDSK